MSKTRKFVEAKELGGKLYLIYDNGDIELVVTSVNVVGLEDAIPQLLDSEDDEDEDEDEDEDVEEESEEDEEDEENLTEADINAMNKKELLALIEEDDLEVDPDEHKTLKKLRAAVIEELFTEEDDEEEEDLEFEDDEEEEDDLEDWDDEDEEEEEEEPKPKKKPGKKKKK